MNTFLAYARRGRNAWWRYVLAALAAAAFTTVLGCVSTLGLMFAHLMPADLPAQMQSPTQPVVFFPAIGVIFGLLLLGSWAAIRLVQAKRFTDIVGAWTWRRFAVGALIWLGVLVIATLIDFLVAPAGFRLTAGNGTLQLGLAAAAGLAVQTFAEEWLFRGWITQGLLLAIRNPVVAAVVSGLLFGALHIPNGTSQALAAVVFGVASALIAIRLGGIAFTFGMHMINNLFGAAVVVSGQDVFKGAPGIFTQQTPGLIWWDLIVVAAALAGLVWSTTDAARKAGDPGPGSDQLL